MMHLEEKKKYIRLIYHSTFRYMGICLILSGVVGGLYKTQIHLLWTIATSGIVMISMGWFGYLHMTTGFRFLFKWNKIQKPRAPYIHQRFKTKKIHVPSFLKDATYFDDDLTDSTIIDDERFTVKQRSIAEVISRITCGIILIILSFLIQF